MSIRMSWIWWLLSKKSSENVSASDWSNWSMTLNFHKCLHPFSASPYNCKSLNRKFIWFIITCYLPLLLITDMSDAFPSRWMTWGLYTCLIKKWCCGFNHPVVRHSEIFSIKFSPQPLSFPHISFSGQEDGNQS